ncbi:MAG: hypothetical protein J6K43_10510 [Lachnospiraceae bacterium]|nr:hypothetical protein [Lachnospiraceae bacterium]
MKFNRKKFAASLLVLLSIVSLTGCSLFGNSKKTYANYVQSLLDVNYKAEFTDYMNITGATQEEAQAVYDDGLNYLAEALMVAYGVNDVEGSDIKSQFVELAKNIYSHASYEITEVTKTDGVYQVTVTIYPIDILLITYDDVVAYIEDMNQRVTAGEYNDYELDDYETEYAQGIIDILTEAIPNIGNGEGVTVTVTILDNEEYYYISDADFLALDKAILATTTVNEDGTTGSTEEAVSEDTN